MCPKGSGEIQTFAQAGGIASAPMRCSASRCVTSAPDGSQYRKPYRLRSRVLPGLRGSLRVNPGTAAASDDAPGLMPRQRICPGARKRSCGTAEGRSLTGGAAGGGGNRVIAGRPRHFPVVALRVSEVGITAVEELGGDRVLRDACACRASPLGQLVHVLGPVDSDDDRAAYAAAAALRVGVGVSAQVIDAEQGEKCAAKLENDEAVGIQDQRPAQTEVEVALARDVRDPERDDVCKRQIVAHRLIVIRRSDKAPFRREITQPDGVGWMPLRAVSMTLRVNRSFSGAWPCSSRCQSGP